MGTASVMGWLYSYLPPLPPDHSSRCPSMSGQLSVLDAANLTGTANRETDGPRRGRLTVLCHRDITIKKCRVR